MKSIFEESSYNELVNRINQVTPDAQAKWGKMNVGQMMHHCQKAFEIPLGKATIKPPNALMKGLFKLFFKSSLYNDKPWKPGLPTAKEFIISEQKDFEKERTILLQIANEYYEQRDRASWPTHPAFGDMTNEQWGKMQYKHLDHHLRQFNA